MFVFCFLVFNASNTCAQFVQIESILVDACDGSVEGENEMLRFQVESAAVNVADIRVDGSSTSPIVYQTSKWPAVANSFLGWVVNPSTAYTAAVAKVATLNATITSSCGRLILANANTTGQGTIAAGKKGLIITSTDFSTTANSFTTLTDTLYVIFQKPGNTSGHFTNYGTAGLRSLRLHKISTGTNEDVTYDKALLINQLGLAGAQDGAGVRFTTAGIATYYNDGCQAPYISLNPNWTSPSSICQSSVPLNLNSLLSSNTTPGGSWSGNGVTGSFFNPAGLIGNISITYSVGNTLCATTATHSILVIASIIPTWVAPSVMCQTSPLLNLNSLLAPTATPGGSWSGNGVSGAGFNPIGLNGNINVSYTVGSPPCTATETHVIQVITKLIPNWVAPENICFMSAAFNLNSLLTDSSTTGGTWTGVGVNGSLFDTTGISGTVSLTYTIGTPPCSASETHSIEECNSSIWLPNIFTPNGDGINDFFFPVYKNIKNISLKIYNRWGIQLFEGSDKLAIWDGKSAGKHCPEGVYFYLVDYEQQGANKGNRQLHGSVSVFY
ncbi:MAG: gliding motility-associated C-terminal domain-containing protein [Bacteroidota bacterium]